MNDPETPLLIAEEVKKYFPVKGMFFSVGRRGVVHAVDGVNLHVHESKALGIVGESGCGKTTLARLILGLIRPTAGTIRFMGQELQSLDKRHAKGLRRQMQMIFQDPFASLNPRKTVSQILAEPFILHTTLRGNEIRAETLKLLETVGLSPPESYVDRYPHEFSGGQRQRIGIARATALHPKLIVADEPVSALDVSVRGQILGLLSRLQEELNLTYVLITHDLAVTRFMCDEVTVMYLGQFVEFGKVDSIFEDPKHPYTKALLAATPIPDPKRVREETRLELSGDVPSAINPPSGCRFRTRCPYVMDVCTNTEPNLIDVNDGHLAACHLYHEQSGHEP